MRQRMFYYIGSFLENVAMTYYMVAAKFYHWAGEHDDEGRLKFMAQQQVEIMQQMIERDAREIKRMTSELN